MSTSSHHSQKGSPTNKLQGKVALVTGAGKRVGAEIAKHLANEGVTVGVHYNHSVDNAQQVVSSIQALGQKAFAIQSDLSNRSECKKLIQNFVQKTKQLDILVLNAANFQSIGFENIQEKDWDFALKLNLEAPFFLSHEAAPYLKKNRGSIIAITCSSTQQPYRNYLPYIVSKGALQHLVRVLALELAPEIRVNAIAPGTVLPPEQLSEKETVAFKYGAPLQSIGKPQDVAQAVQYLAQASFVTGQEIRVDGGRTIGTSLKG